MDGSKILSIDLMLMLDLLHNVKLSGKTASADHDRMKKFQEHFFVKLLKLEIVVCNTFLISMKLDCFECRIKLFWLNKRKKLFSWIESSKG